MEIAAEKKGGRCVQKDSKMVEVADKVRCPEGIRASSTMLTASVVDIL